MYNGVTRRKDSAKLYRRVGARPHDNGFPTGAWAHAVSCLVTCPRAVHMQGCIASAQMSGLWYLGPDGSRAVIGRNLVLMEWGHEAW